MLRTRYTTILMRARSNARAILLRSAERGIKSHFFSQAKRAEARKVTSHLHLLLKKFGKFRYSYYLCKLIH